MADAYVKVVIDTDQVIDAMKAHIRERIEPLLLAIRTEGHRPGNAHTGCEICSALATLDGGTDGA